MKKRLSLQPQTNLTPNANLDALAVSIKPIILTPALANNSKNPAAVDAVTLFRPLPKKIITDIDKRPCAPFIANVADKHFRLLVETFDCGGGGLAKRDCPTR